MNTRTYERYVGPTTYVEGSATATTHTVKQDYARVTECYDCGQGIKEELIEAGREYTENHHYDRSGVCYVCNQQREDPASCQHGDAQWGWYDEFIGRPEAVSDGPIGHHYTNAVRVHKLVCGACGATIQMGESEPCERFGEHFIIDGVCEDCGFEERADCPHSSNPVTGTLQRITYEKLDYNQHNMLVREWTVSKCPDCGKIFSNELTKDETTAQEHTFENGVCTLCGQKACTHENAVLEETPSNCRDYKPVDGEKHSFIADAVMTKTCPDCGNVSTETVVGQQYRERHQLDESGKCALCDYCDHRSKTVTQTPIRGTDTYTDNQDGETHIHFWNVHRLVVCPNCGILEDVDVAEPESEREGHIYANGFCIACDAACPHTETVYENKHFDWPNAEVTRYNDTVHVITANMIADEKCSACGATVARNVPVEKNVELTERHEFDGEGKCMTQGCGATNSCSHDGTTHVESFEDYYGQVYATCVDDKVHSIPGVKVTQTICDLCGAILEKTEEDWPVLEPHSIRDGRCTFPGCGYEGEGCKHENQRKETDEILQRNQKSIGHDEHEYYVDVTEVVTCEDCGEILSRKTTQTGVRKVEEHMFIDDGVCFVCGATEHPNRETKQEYGQMDVFEPIDVHTHSFLADVYEVVTCEDCGEQLSRTKVASAAKQTGEHSFDEKGVCTLCHYCSHKVTEKQSTDLLETTQYADNHDGETHVRTWDVQIDNVCVNCGKVVGESGMEMESTTERHSYGDNCTCACGAVHHEHTKVPAQYFDMGSIEVVSYNAASHTVRTNIVGDEICQDCHRVVERNKVIEENVTFTISHELDSEGKCRDCGYVPTCAHEHIGIDEEYNDNRSTASAWDEEGHTVVAEKYVYTYCEDCGTLLKRETTTTEPIKLPHRFVNGVDTCIVDGCEANNECTHSSTEESIYENNAHNYVSISGSEHRYVAEIVKAVYCADCGVLLSREVMQQSATLTEEHGFAQGVCVSCGYVKPAETPKPAPTPPAGGDLQADQPPGCYGDPEADCSHARADGCADRRADQAADCRDAV